MSDNSWAEGAETPRVSPKEINKILILNITFIEAILLERRTGDINSLRKQYRAARTFLALASECVGGIAENTAFEQPVGGGADTRHALQHQLEANG